jgi:hypothetical protein
VQKHDSSSAARARPQLGRLLHHLLLLLLLLLLLQQVHLHSSAPIPELLLHLTQQSAGMQLQGSSRRALCQRHLDPKAHSCHAAAALNVMHSLLPQLPLDAQQED